jgi:ABC-2 type transport system permease protein
MSHVLSIAKRELRAYFLSPLALIFLGTYLVVTLFVFFWVETFFARNIADVRPLFLWLPRLLIFLCAALTMRLWSEEQKLGTLEILLTLPVEVKKLVAGKFLAALGLVAVALALTLGIPITVSIMSGGQLDWGPVIGGYFGAILLAGAYLAIGLCVSALTENQIVALIVTALICALLYALGAEPVTNLAGTRGAEILRALGIGSRFESILRGVIDLRDVAYYAALIVTFLVLNVVILESKRWSQGARTAPKRTNLKVMAGLVAVNAVFFSIWFSSVGLLRIDLTQRGEYSISDTTKNMVRSLDNPLLIRAYISGKTHPLLAPLVPRIRDLIEEYAILSRGKVKAEFVDPKDDAELEKEANEVYGIKSFPFRVMDRYEAGVVNSYFSILLKYGDQHEVLPFDQLIEVGASNTGVEVKLRNLEYDLTRAIKKVAFGFQTLESVFAEMPKDAELTAYITPKTLPDNFKDVPKRLEKVLGEIKAQSGGKFKYNVVDPDAQGGTAMREELYKNYGFRPMAVGFLSQESFYLHLLLRVGDHVERVFPAESMSEADIRKEVTAAVKRSTPGFLKTVGLVKPKSGPPPQANPFQPQPPQHNEDNYRLVQEKLKENYTLRDVTIDDGRVPGDVDVLVLLAPKDYTEKQAFAVDQYLMRGGTVVVIGGKYEFDTQATSQEGTIAVRKVRTGLEDVLSAYGISLGESMVLDPQNEPFAQPVIRNLGGLKIRDVQLLNYPFFVDVRPTGMDKNSPVVASLPALTMSWASPLIVSSGADAAPSKDPKDDGAPKRQVEVLLRSTPESWTQAEPNVQPPPGGFAPSGERKSQPLAVAVRGRFESAYKDKPSPVYGADAAPGADRTGRTIKQSPDGARLVVVGSSNFVNDMVLQLSRQGSGERYMNNVQFVENLADWAVADVDLLSIRSRGTFGRTLLPMDADKRAFWEYLNYGIVVLALVGLVGGTMGRRRRLAPMQLDPSSRGGRGTPRPGPAGIGGEPTEVRS